jgi:regulatory protein
VKQRISTFDRAVLILEYRPRSVMELRRSLEKKKEPADAIDQAIERLRDAGGLDDAQYARQFARSKALGAGFSRRRIQLELSRRGVARDITDEAIAAVFVDEAIDESEAIDRLVRKKLGKHSLHDQATVRRVYAFLARRGYGADAIRAGLGRARCCAGGPQT